MLKTILSLALAASFVAAPSFAENDDEKVRAPVAPVTPTNGLPSKGLGGAIVVGGAAALGLVGLAAVALHDDDDDNASATTTSR